MNFINSNNFTNTGFTIIEVLLVLAIVAIILSIGLPIGWNFYLSYDFDSQVDTFVSLLERARNLAMINSNEADRGIYIGADQFTVFQGSSYASRDISQDQDFPRNSGVAISGPSELVFGSLSGRVASSTFAFSRNDRNINIYVNSEGTISY